MDKLRLDQSIHAIQHAKGGNKNHTLSIRHEVYDRFGYLDREIRDLVMKRISYLLFIA